MYKFEKFRGIAMVTSIVLTGMYDIGISASNKIKTPDGVLVDIKDIPFVRYRFSDYGEEEIQFIKKNMDKFPCTHLIEIDISEKAFEVLDRIEELGLELARFVYINLTEDMATKGLSDDILALVDKLMNHTFDTLNLRDVSESLFPIALSNIKRQLKEATGLRENEIGVCGGPCCFYNGNACLTAVKAREIQALYAKDVDNAVVPSANHEGSLDSLDNLDSCVNKCGCIRYHIFSHSVEAPNSFKDKGKTKKEKVSAGDADTPINVDRSGKKVKCIKPRGYTKIIW